MRLRGCHLYRLFDMSFGEFTTVFGSARQLGVSYPLFKVMFHSSMVPSNERKKGF